MEENNRQRYLQLITKKVVSFTLLCLVIMCVFFYFTDLIDEGRTYLVLVVFFCGLVGGFVSHQQRLPKIGDKELYELSNSWLNILIIPINGGIFAIVLMLLFMSGIIKGAMFPEYSHYPINHSQDELVKSYVLWLNNSFPQRGEDITKLLFWSFVSGFSERFVPQIIQTTIKQTGKQEKPNG